MRWLWAAAAVVIAAAMGLAAQSPLLAWRDPVYILGGFAGIAGLALMLVQPLLMAGGRGTRRAHVWVGGALVAAVGVHVGALWITSPPDVIDVLLFRSPTPFGIWGAVAMWAVIAAAGFARCRGRLRRLGHAVAVTVAVAGTVAHAWLVEGAMEVVSKAVLCGAVVAVLLWVQQRRRVWR